MLIMLNDNDLPKPDLYVKSFHVAGVIFKQSYKNKGNMSDVHKELIDDIATEVGGTPLTMMVADNPENYQGQEVDPKDNPYFVSLKLFQEFKAKKLKCNMDRTLLRDVIENVESGVTFIAAIKPSNLEDNLQPPPPELDPSYVLTVYLQMWERATDEKEKREKNGENLPIIYFDFYGVTTGNNGLWDKMYPFFKNFPEHVPPNVCLRIYDCTGKPKLCGQVIQGKGNINHNYKETVEKFLKLGCKNAGVFHPDNISQIIQRKLAQESKIQLPKVAVVNTANQRLEEISLVAKAPEIPNDGLEVSEAKFEAVEEQSQAADKLTELQVDNLIFTMEISDLHSLLNQAKPAKLAALSEYFQKHGMMNISFSNLSSVLLQKAIFTRLNDLLQYELTLPTHLPRLIDTYIKERASNKGEKVIDDFNSILVLLSRIPQGELGKHRTGKNKSLDALIVQFFRQKASEILAIQDNRQIKAHRYQVEQHRIAGGILSGLDTVYYFEENSSIQEKIDGIVENLQSELFNPKGYVRNNISKKELINNWIEFKASFLNKLRAELFLLVAQGQREEMRKEVLAIISQALFTPDCALYKVLHNPDNKGLLADMISAWEMANLIEKTKDGYVLRAGINVPQFPVPNKQKIIEEIAPKIELIEEPIPQKELPVPPRECTILQALLLIAQIEYSLSKLQEGDQKKKIEEFLEQLRAEVSTHTKAFVIGKAEHWFEHLRLQVVTDRFDEVDEAHSRKIFQCQHDHENFDATLRAKVLDDIRDKNAQLEDKKLEYRHVPFSDFLVLTYERDYDFYQLDIGVLTKSYEDFRRAQGTEWEHLRSDVDATSLEKLEKEYQQYKFDYLTGTFTSQAFASLKSIVEELGKQDKNKKNINNLYFFLDELVNQTMFVAKENRLTSPQEQIIRRVLAEVAANKNINILGKEKIVPALSALRTITIDINKPFISFEIDNFFDFTNPEEIFKKLIEEFNSPNFLSCVTALCKYSLHFTILFNSLSNTKDWTPELLNKALQDTGINTIQAKEIINQLLMNVIPYQMTRMTRLRMMLTELVKVVQNCPIVSKSLEKEIINTQATISDLITISNLCIGLSDQIGAINSHLAIPLKPTKPRFSLSAAPKYWETIETSSSENLKKILNVFQSKLSAINNSEYIEMLNKKELLKSQKQNPNTDIVKSQEAQTLYSQLGFTHTPKEMVDELLNSIEIIRSSQNDALTAFAKQHKDGKEGLIRELEENVSSFKLLCTITSYLENERKKYPDEENQEQEEEKGLNNFQC
jgi:hypothetical protein